jgi:hypothetical protein
MGITWPNGHKFAFTVIDDTDGATVARVKPIYDMLARLGMRTTKTAWMFPGEGIPVCGGSTCEDPDYLNWLLDLRAQGFEIGFHNAAPCTSRRELTQVALTRFRKLFGPGEALFCNHTQCLENMYWGDARLSGWRRNLYNLLTLSRRRGISHGHVKGDPRFWGDICQQGVRYVRNFVFDEPDALAVCPEQPYHDPQKPYVNFWFTSTDGGDIKRFLTNLTQGKLRRLAESGGLCITYVHFASGFMCNGMVNPEFQKRMEFLTSLNGWFAPASQILDHLRQGARTQERIIDPSRLRELELKWLFQKLTKGTT